MKTTNLNIKWTDPDAVAGFDVINMWELPNEYLGNGILLDDKSDDYEIRSFINHQSYRLSRPWWLVKTRYGLIKIGPRKRVVSIDWSDTGLRKIITEEGVTKSETMVHAYTDLDIIKYLQTLRSELLEYQNVCTHV